MESCFDHVSGLAKCFPRLYFPMIHFCISFSWQKCLPACTGTQYLFIFGTSILIGYYIIIIHRVISSQSSNHSYVTIIPKQFCRSFNILWHSDYIGKAVVFLDKGVRVCCLSSVIISSSDARRWYMWYFVNDNLLFSNKITTVTNIIILLTIKFRAVAVPYLY